MTSPKVHFSGPAPTWDESGEIMETTGELYVNGMSIGIRLWWYPGDLYVHADILANVTGDVRMAVNRWAAGVERAEWFEAVHKAFLEEERQAGLEADYYSLHRALHVAERWN